MKKNSWKVYLNQKLKDPTFKEGFERERRILSLGIALAKSREKQGLTQEAVAKRIGTSAPQVSRTEKTPENANVRTLLRYANAIDMDLKVKLVPKIKRSSTKRPFLNIQSPAPYKIAARMAAYKKK